MGRLMLRRRLKPRSVTGSLTPEAPLKCGDTTHFSRLDIGSIFALLGLDREWDVYFVKITEREALRCYTDGSIMSRYRPALFQSDDPVVYLTLAKPSIRDQNRAY